MTYMFYRLCSRSFHPIMPTVTQMDWQMLPPAPSSLLNSKHSAIVIDSGNTPLAVTSFNYTFNYLQRLTSLCAQLHRTTMTKVSHTLAA